MQVVIKTLLRIFALLFHLFQAVISLTAGLYVSAVIGALLFGVYIYDLQTIRRIFHTNPFIISSIGSIAWICVAIVELSLKK